MIEMLEVLPQRLETHGFMGGCLENHYCLKEEFNPKKKITVLLSDSINGLYEICCREFEILMKDLVGVSRKTEVVLARHVANSILFACTKMTTKAMGKAMGGRDHSTASHSLNSFANEFETNPGYRQMAKNILLAAFENREVAANLNPPAYRDSIKPQGFIGYYDKWLREAGLLK